MERFRIRIMGSRAPKSPDTLLSQQPSFFTAQSPHSQSQGVEGFEGLGKDAESMCKELLPPKIQVHCIIPPTLLRLPGITLEG